VTNLRRSNYVDDTCDGRRAAVKKQKKNRQSSEFETRFQTEVPFLEIS